MGHVEECAGRIALDAHVLALGQTGERREGARTSYARFVVFVGREVGDAADGVALDFHVRAVHLPDERGEAAEGDNQDFVLAWAVLVVITYRARLCWRRTIYGEIAKRSRSCSLDFYIWAFEEEEDRFEGRAVYGSDTCGSRVNTFLEYPISFMPYLAR